METASLSTMRLCIGVTSARLSILSMSVLFGWTIWDSKWRLQTIVELRGILVLMWIIQKGRSVTKQNMVRLLRLLVPGFRLRLVNSSTMFWLLPILIVSFLSLSAFPVRCCFYRPQILCVLFLSPLNSCKEEDKSNPEYKSNLSINIKA